MRQSTPCLSAILIRDPLFTHILPLDQIAAAFTLLAARPDGFLKALVRCD